MHLFHNNLTEIRDADARLPSDQVIVVCDTRDPVAKEWAKLGGDEIALNKHQVSCAIGRLVPTVIVAVPREAATDLTAIANPAISEVMETLPPDTHRIVLIISGGGTMFQALPRGPVRSVIEIGPDS